MRRAAFLLALAASPLAAQQPDPAPQPPVIVIPAPEEQSLFRFPQA